MKKRLIAFIILLIGFSLVSYGEADAWNDDVTHRFLSELAAEVSVMNGTDPNRDPLKEIGLGSLDTVLELLDGQENLELTVKKWIARGAELEDEAAFGWPVTGNMRSINHYHAPTRPWSQAGFNDIFLEHLEGQSSLLWAQDGADQSNFIRGDYSWKMMREYYHAALVNTTEADRQANFARTFLGIGHQVHLIEDSAMPDHTRNDNHPLDSTLRYGPFNALYFETWAEWEFPRVEDLRDFVGAPIFPSISLSSVDPGALDPEYASRSMVPTALLIDADVYDGTNPAVTNTPGVGVGISEYTNANYFSGDTVFAAENYAADPTHKHYFPYPKKTSTNVQSFIDQSLLPKTIVAEDGISEPSFYISKTADGEQVTHFLKPGYYSNNLYNNGHGGVVYHQTFYRDEKCHEEYAQNLLPRAVGYSAALIDYFFRGQLDISPPDQYAYAVINGIYTNPEQFKLLRAKVTNTTPNEDMTGQFEAVLKYKIIPQDPPYDEYELTNYPPPTIMNTIDYSYSVGIGNITSLSTGETKEAVFDFSGDPIPVGITDLSMNVVFRGTLGAEPDNAVAVGYKDLMEPSHNVFWNLTDQIYIDGTLYTSAELLKKKNKSKLALVDTNGNGEFNDPGELFMDYDMFMQITYLANATPTGTEPVIAQATLPPGRHMRLVTIVEKVADNPLHYHDVMVGFPDTSGTMIEQFAQYQGVWNEGDMTIATQEETFRFWNDGSTDHSFIQHFHQGVLSCIGGGDPYLCPYPEAQSQEATRVPFPADINP